MLKVDLLSLFPSYFEGPTQTSMLKQAQMKGLIELGLIDIRDFSTDKHHRVDDRPFGGGPGMVMQAEPVAKAIRSVRNEKSHVVFFSPQGKVLDAQKARELASYEHLIFLCGHYEGVDQRIIDSEVDEELSIGDYVLTNGCLAALVTLDALVRFVPGVLGHEEGANEDSFEKGIFDHPHYTKPLDFEGKQVPTVLRSGDHKAIEDWRYCEALKKTAEQRKDLFLQHLLEECEPKNSSSASIDLLFIVQNLSLAKRFYRKILGFSTVRQSERLLVMEKDGKNLYLHEGNLDASPNRSVHILHQSKDTVEQIERCQRRERLGSLIKRYPRKLHLQDPDGNMWVIQVINYLGENQ